MRTLRFKDTRSTIQWPKSSKKKYPNYQTQEDKDHYIIKKDPPIINKPIYNMKVTEGEYGQVTEEVYNTLPEDLQKRLETVLNNYAPPQNGQGVKQLTGKPKFQGVAYQYELKFLGAYGKYRCYGNKVGGKVVFTVCDPDGTLH